MTTDLLSVWTDPDTAMEAVGASLGIFDAPATGARSAIAADAALRAQLLGVLRALVRRGELETRRLADGRDAFRWRRDFAPAAVATGTASPRLAACVSGVGRAPARASVRWPWLLSPAVPLLFAATACLLVLLAFVLLAQPVAVAVAVALAVVGVAGVARRVPFAALWVVGVVLAGALVRVS